MTFEALAPQAPEIARVKLNMMLEEAEMGDEGFIRRMVADPKDANVDKLLAKGATPRVNRDRMLQYLMKGLHALYLVDNVEKDPVNREQLVKVEKAFEVAEAGREKAAQVMLQEAINYFRTMSDVGLQPNVEVFTALIDGLCKNNCIEAAKELFNEMLDNGLTPDKVAYTTLIDGNLKHGNLQEALSMHERMKELGMEIDLHAYTSLIWGFSYLGQMQQAKALLDEMIGKGILPDEILIVCLVRKYYELGNADEAIKLQTEWRNRALGTGTSDYVVPNARN